MGAYVYCRKCKPLLVHYKHSVEKHSGCRQSSRRCKTVTVLQRSVTFLDRARCLRRRHLVQRCRSAVAPSALAGLKWDRLIVVLFWQVCLGSIELSDEIERLSTELSNCEEERDLFLQVGSQRLVTDTGSSLVTNTGLRLVTNTGIRLVTNIGLRLVKTGE